MINENILINRRKWIIEKIDEYLRGKITRKELHKWIVTQRDMERNPSEISNTLDVLILLNEPEELGLVTNEDLLDFKKYMHKSETIFQKYIMPKKGEIAGYYWFETEEGEISVYRIFYEDGKKILEHAVYKDSEPIHIHQAILKKREGDSKQPYDEIGKKHEDWKKGIIDRESYIEFILKVLENEGMKEWYSGILTFYADHDDWYLKHHFYADLYRKERG